MSDDKKDYYGEEAFSHLPSDYKPSVTPDKAPRRWPMFELVATEYSEHEQFVLASDYDALEAELQRERRKVALLYTELNYYIMDCGRKQAEQKEIDKQLEAIDKGG